MNSICETCGLEYNSWDYYQHIKSVKHLEVFGHVLL